MNEPLFDAISTLCWTAVDEGYASVADALELVLDVYLLEHVQKTPPHPMFRSKRGQTGQEIAIWNADLIDDADTPKRQPTIDWSMTNFPLLRAI